MHGTDAPSTFIKRAKHSSLPATTHGKAKLVGTASKVLVNLMINGEDPMAPIRVCLENGVFDEEIDVPRITKAMKSIFEKQSFPDEEFNTYLDFIIQYLSSCSPQQKRNNKETATKLVNIEQEKRKCMAILHRFSWWINQDPTLFEEMVVSQAERFLSSGNTMSFQSVTPQVKWLEDKATSIKILFRFIMGKLDGDLANQILGEIADLLMEQAVDSINGAAVPILFIQKYMEDLLTETKTSPNYSASVPAVVHIKSGCNLENLTETTCKALRVEEVPNNREPLLNLITSTKKLTLVELHGIDASRFSQDCNDNFAKALSQSSALSLSLDTLNGIDFVQCILEKLSTTLGRLVIRGVTESDTYKFPSQAHLKCLYIEDSLSGVTQLFTSNFPHLTTLSVMSHFRWSENDINTLHTAVMEGRMPLLEHLCTTFSGLAGYGTYLVDIMRRPSMKTADFTDTSLTQGDGKILLKALEHGSLGHIQSLTLLHNPRLTPLIGKLISVCDEQHIDLQCANLPGTSPFRFAIKLLSRTAFSSIRRNCTTFCSRQVIGIIIIGMLSMYFSLVWFSSDES